jgi:hypothetical protein
VAERVVYLDRFKLRSGKLDEFRDYAEKIVEVVRESEPDTVSVDYYIDEASGEGTALLIFSTPEAMDRHIELTKDRWQEAIDLISSSQLELLGSPSEAARQLAAAYGAAQKGALVGFSRS